MARRFSAGKTLITFLDAACVTASLLGGADGFRVKDMHFYLELFSNWQAFELRGIDLRLQATQLRRHLETLKKDGWLEQLLPLRKQRFRLTHIGMASMLERMSGQDHLRPPEETLFVSYMLSAYQPVLNEHLLSDTKYLTDARRAALKDLINPVTPLKKHRAKLMNVIKDYETRMEESSAMADYAGRMFAKGEPAAKVLDSMSKYFSYQLSAQRSLKDLYKGMPSALWRTELERGPLIRNTLLFDRLTTLLASQLTVIDNAIATQSGDS